MTQGSDSIGGFFTKSGELKDPKKLTPAESSKSTGTKQAAKNSQAAQDQEAVSKAASKDLSAALSRVSDRTRADVNQAINSNDAARSDLNRAKDVVKLQRDKLDEIREAEKEGASEEKITKLKAEFKEIEKSRNDLAREIEKNSRAREQQGASFIRVGNREAARVQPRKVELKESNTDLDSKEGLKAAREQLKDDTQSIKDQGDKLRDERAEIKDALKQARGIIGEIERNGNSKSSAISSIEEADKVAQSTRDLILQAGSSAVVNKLDPASVSKLLTS